MAPDDGSADDGSADAGSVDDGSAAATSTSIYYPVHIVQQPPNSMVCWYCCLQMIVGYQRGVGQPGLLHDPSEVDWVKSLYDKNSGIGAPGQPSFQSIADALGFKTVYQTMTADGFHDLLATGPIMYAGGPNPSIKSGHCVVINGISDSNIAAIDPYGLSGSGPLDSFISAGNQQMADGSWPIMSCP
jgi:hypothetical protein